MTGLADSADNNGVSDGTNESVLESFRMCESDAEGLVCLWNCLMMKKVYVTNERPM